MGLSWTSVLYSGLGMARRSLSIPAFLSALAFEGLPHYWLRVSVVVRGDVDSACSGLIGIPALWAWWYGALR